MAQSFNFIHKEYAAGKWFKLSFAEQMANVGSDVERTIRWHQKDDKEPFESAFYRAIELLDLTIQDPRWKRRLKELCRIRELLGDFFFGDNIYKTTPQFLKNYFDYFTFIARANK